MPLRKTHVLMTIALASLALTACGKKPAEEPTAVDPAVQAQIDRDAELKAREEELNRQLADMALKEKEKDLADREAALAKASKRRSRRRSRLLHRRSPLRNLQPTPVAAGPKTYTVPAGTSVSVQIPAEMSTKTAQVGQRFTANLTSDLVVNGVTVARAGAPVQGSVTEVISGSKTIGGKPTLALTFDQMTFAGGDMPINGRLTQVAAKSDKGRDTAKIAGGAIAGGVVGHQFDSDQGKVIGAILGAAAGTAAAKKTGKEVVLPAGTVLGFTLDSPVNVTM